MKSRGIDDRKRDFAFETTMRSSATIFVEGFHCSVVISLDL
jgi:hypothetical protein